MPGFFTIVFAIIFNLTFGGLILFGLYWSLWGQRSDNKKKWLRWPTLEEYWAAHPDSRTRTGTRCHHCNSSHIRYRHFTGKSGDGMLIYKCNQCQTALYRSLAN